MLAEVALCPVQRGQHISLKFWASTKKGNALKFPLSFRQTR